MCVPTGLEQHAGECALRARHDFVITRMGVERPEGSTFGLRFRQWLKIQIIEDWEFDKEEGTDRVSGPLW